jgi:hypothetical protein
MDEGAVVAGHRTGKWTRAKLGGAEAVVKGSGVKEGYVEVKRR